MVLTIHERISSILVAAVASLVPGLRFAAAVCIRGEGVRRLRRESRAVGVEREERMSGKPAEGLFKEREQRRGGEAGACRHGCARAHMSPRDAADNAHAPPTTR